MTIKQRLHIKKTSPSSYRNPLLGRFKLYQGANGNDTSIWYTHDDLISSGMFRAIRFVDEVNDSTVEHTGWYSDMECNSKLRGFIVMLSRGRFLSGYYSTDNGEWVLFPDLFNDLDDACLNADSEAQINARLACEYDERFQECRRLEDERERMESRVRELDVLVKDDLFKQLEVERVNHLQGIKIINDKINSEYSEFV